MSTMVIEGKPAPARSGATVEIHDPATGELVDKVPQAGVEETREAIDAAHAAFRGWADTLPQKRAQILMKWDCAMAFPELSTCLRGASSQ